MNIDKRTLITVGASTAIGFVGDLLVYSLAESKGKPFRIHMPRGKQLATLIVMGIVVGVGIDLIVKFIENSQKTQEELLLDDLIEKERQRILAGNGVTGKKPTQVVWA